MKAKATQKAAQKKAHRRRAQPVHVSYIVGASGGAVTERDLEDIRGVGVVSSACADGVRVDGFHNSVTAEGGDRHMQRQIVEYLAAHPVTPHDPARPRCCAFAHTGNLSPRGCVDMSCASFRSPSIQFDADQLLRQIASEERRSKGFFAPFAEKHVRKVALVYPNHRVTNANGVSTAYLVELCALTAFGVFVARGQLKLNGPLERVEKTPNVPYTFPGSHVNWTSWGVDSERTWAHPRHRSTVGSPW